MNDFAQEQKSLTVRQPAPAGMDAMMRAEIDMQISTAHAYPRSLTKVARNVTELVTMSKETAGSCIYSLPRGGKAIVGPSIRLAEILFSQWGNCTGGSRTVEVNRVEGYIEAEGIFHDLETNSKTVKRVRRSIKNRNGGTYTDDMIIVTANAAGSIAFRNATLAGVPRSIWGEAYAMAEHTIKGDVKTLPERRDAGMKAMAAFGLSSEDVCKILGVEGLRDIGIDELVVIGGYHNALKDGEVEAEKLLRDADERIAAEEKPAKPKSAKPKPAKKAEVEAEVVEDEEPLSEGPEEGTKSKNRQITYSVGESKEHQITYSHVTGDITDGAPIDATLEFHKDALAETLADNPDYHAQLMAEIGA